MARKLLFENEEVYYEGERDAQGIWFGEGKLRVKVKYRDSSEDGQNPKKAADKMEHVQSSDKDGSHNLKSKLLTFNGM
jgi:hypothetical protein